MDKLAVGFLLFEDVDALDLVGPLEVFSRTRLEPGVASRRDDETAPFQVFTVARTADPVRASGGLLLVPSFTFATAPPIDLLMLPGGFGTRGLLHHEPTLAWIREAASHARTVASVCTGSLLLARAGLLEGRRATTHWGALDLLASLGAITVERDARFVDDGVLTSAGVASGIDLAFHLVERLCGRAVADETARYIEYRRLPAAS